jgi:hypothetical protein
MMKMTTVKPDPAIAAAQRYFDAKAELDALQKLREAAFPGDLNAAEQERWLAASRARALAEIDLAYAKPKSVEGVMKTLAVAIDRLEGLSGLLAEANGKNIPLIVQRAEQALQSIEAAKRKDQRHVAALPKARARPSVLAAARLAKTRSSVMASPRLDEAVTLSN